MAVAYLGVKSTPGEEHEMLLSLKQIKELSAIDIIFVVININLIKMVFLGFHF